MPDNIRFSNPDTMQKPPGYSHVVEVTGPGRTVYFAGQQIGGWWLGPTIHRLETSGESRECQTDFEKSRLRTLGLNGYSIGLLGAALLPRPSN